MGGGEDSSLGAWRWPPLVATGGVGLGTEIPSRPFPDSNSFACVPTVGGASAEADRRVDGRTGFDNLPSTIVLRGLKSFGAAVGSDVALLANGPTTSAARGL